MTRIEPMWTGLLQAAFKHQNIVQGVTDAHYVRRPDIQLPVPPISTIDVTYEAVANLRDIYGVDAEGNLYVLGPESKVEEMGDRKVITIAGVGHGEAEEDEILVDHELGTFFYGAISLAPDGRVLTVSNTPSFYMFAPDGSQLVSHRALRAGKQSFEAPAEGEPFWLTGAGGIAAGRDGFVVGGAPMYRVDHYDWDGKLKRSIRSFEYDGQAWDLATERISKVCLDPTGRIYASSASNVFVFTPDGEIETVVEASRAEGPAGDFHLWIGVDRDAKLWSQFYKGKEVAYAAYTLPFANA